jgi:hypothetical protein
MGHRQEQDDQKPESSVEHERKSSLTSEVAGQLPAEPHDMKQPDSDPNAAVLAAAADTVGARFQAHQGGLVLQ